MDGTTIGPYRITGLIGQGGMGAVYAAEHTLLGRQAAIKVLHAEMSARQDVVMRFFNEARAATAIRHPGIVEVYDFGWTPEQAAYIVMELLRGESLGDRHQRAPLRWQLVLSV
ncbi:MAG TPA: protein kinase, partial [Kofleriaceae bacterium]